MLEVIDPVALQQETVRVSGYTLSLEFNDLYQNMVRTGEPGISRKVSSKSA